MEILVDQRIELLAVIQTLSGYWDNFAQKYMKKSHFASNYKIIISPLIMGCYSISMNNDLEKKCYQIMCPTEYNNKYIFNYPEPIIHILWHEISHTIINDLTEKYINEFDIKNVKIPENIKNTGYSIAEVVINEYIIRAIVYMLVELNECENSAALQLEVEKNFGFTEVKNLKNYIIENCEKNNKLLLDENYRKLMKFVINKILK